MRFVITRSSKVRFLEGHRYGRLTCTSVDFHSVISSISQHCLPTICKSGAQALGCLPCALLLVDPECRMWVSYPSLPLSRMVCWGARQSWRLRRRVGRLACWYMGMELNPFRPWQSAWSRGALLRLFGGRRGRQFGERGEGAAVSHRCPEMLGILLCFEKVWSGWV